MCLKGRSQGAGSGQAGPEKQACVYYPKQSGLHPIHSVVIEDFYTEGITQPGLFWTEKSGRIKEAQRGVKRVGWIVPMLLLFVCFCLFLATLGLCCYTWAFSNWSEQGLSQVVMHGLLIAVASPVAEHGL